MDSEDRKTENKNSPVEDNVSADLCALCKQADMDRSKSAHSILCRTCREKMIRYPIPKAFILFSLIIAIITGIAFYNFPKVLAYYQTYENSLAQASNGNIRDTLESLQAVIEKYPDATPISVRTVDISMNAGYYDYAGYILSTYLAGKKMDENIVNRLNQYIDKLNRYNTSYEAIIDINSTLSAGSPEEMRKECYSGIQKLLADPEQDKSVLYYYLAMSSEDVNQMKSNLESSINEDENFAASKVQLANIIRRQGDTVTAEKYLNDILRKDASDSGALRGLAIIRLLEGNSGEGLSLARKAFEINPEELYAWETYIIALNENNMSDDADVQKKEYLAKGNVLDEDTRSYLSGEVTLHDYYIGE